MSRTILKLSQKIVLLLVLFILAIGGCKRKSDTQPPSNREDVPIAGPDNGADSSDVQPLPSDSLQATEGKLRRNQYTVQVGIFKLAKEAEKLAYELRLKNINNFIQPVNDQWRVCVGRFYSEKRASRMIKQLRKMGFSGKIIALGS
jgi:cell division septation protein DedD